MCLCLPVEMGEKSAVHQQKQPPYDGLCNYAQKITSCFGLDGKRSFAHDLCVYLYRRLVFFVFALGLCSCCIVFLCKGVVSDMCAEAGLVFVRRNGAVCCAAERFILTLPLSLMCCV